VVVPGRQFVAAALLLLTVLSDGVLFLSGALPNPRPGLGIPLEGLVIQLRYSFFGLDRCWLGLEPEQRALQRQLGLVGHRQAVFNAARS
jgi:hypothetical protein